MKRILPLTVVLTCATFGCATLKSNTFIGASIGASAGAVTGTLIGAPNHSGTGTLIGAASGLVLGGLIGLLTEPKKQSTTSETSQKNDESKKPSFTSPEVRKIWVPDKIEGNKFIKGHEIYVLERGSVWTMP